MVFNSSFVISEIWQIFQPKKEEKLVEFSTRKNQKINLKNPQKFPIFMV
jgi:hypothetical protein